MTTEYKTLRVPAPAYKKAKENKRDGETWGEYLQRCTDNPPEIREFVEADKIDTGTAELEATTINQIAEEVARRLK